MSDARTRILYVAEWPDHAAPVGALLRLLPRLEPEKFSAVLVFPGEPGPGALRFQHAGAMVHSLAVPAADGRRGIASSTLAAHRLVKFAKELVPDIAHALDEPSSALVAIAGRIAGVPILVGALREHARRPPSWARRMALRKLDHLIAPSESLKAEASRLLGGRHPPITVVQDGVDPLEVRGFARAPELSEPRLRVGSWLRLAKGAGVEELIEAAALLRARFPDFEWLVLGTGDDAMGYLRLAQRRGVEATVRFLGEREDVGPLLASLDAYVSPGGTDAAPSGLLHALVAGLPCVAVENPSLEDMLVGGRDVVFVPPGDARALADGAARVLEDGARDLRASLRAAGARIAPACSADAMASGVQALYAAANATARGEPAAARRTPLA
jgi:glycosyltransferase involved in cell wall biosynthesis